MSDKSGNAIYLLLCLVLVASSLIGRRLPWRQSIKMALAWLAIFGVLITIASYRYDIGRAFARIKSELLPGNVVENGGTLRIRVGDNGHYFVNAVVNGKSVRFMIDSGATKTTLTSEDARAANVPVDQDGMPVAIETASGLAQARRARVAHFAVGPIIRDDYPVLVSDTLGENNLIGMDFLNRLKGWRVEGDEMVFNP